MKVKRIEHVGIVVRDVEASRKLWEGCFGIKLGGTEDNTTRRLALNPTPGELGTGARVRMESSSTMFLR